MREASMHESRREPRTSMRDAYAEKSCPSGQLFILIVCVLFIAVTPWLYITYTYKGTGTKVASEMSLVTLRQGIKKDFDAQMSGLLEQNEQVERPRGTSVKPESFAQTRDKSDNAVETLRSETSGKSKRSSGEAVLAQKQGKHQELQQSSTKSMLRVPMMAPVPSSSLSSAAGTIKPRVGTLRSHEDRPLAIVTAITKANDQYIAGALVLQESVRQHGGKYAMDFKFVVLVPEGVTGFDALEHSGWDIVEAPMPVDVSLIEGPLRTSIGKSGCCGANELVKLKIFALTDYRRAIFFDADAMVTGSLDTLVEDDATQWTFDVGLGGGCINGGFLATTPNMKEYNGMVAAVKKGDWDQGGGAWGHSGIGYCYGGQTFQGVVPYYFQELSKEPWKNLDVYKFNNMGKYSPKPGEDVPYHGDTAGVHSVHFTWCQKPWSCNMQQTDVCLAFHKSFRASLVEATKRTPNNHALEEINKNLGRCPMRPCEGNRCH